MSPRSSSDGLLAYLQLYALSTKCFYCAKESAGTHRKANAAKSQAGQARPVIGGSLGSSAFLEVERGRVDAVALAGRGRTIVEQVAQVGAAVGALHLDAQHLIREAVANAVRHAGAKSVTIRLRSDADQLKLDFINDGARYPTSPLTGEMPRSMSERVKLAGGALELTRGMGVTRISVSLPISGRVH